MVYKKILKPPPHEEGTPSSDDFLRLLFYSEGGDWEATEEESKTKSDSKRNEANLKLIKPKVDSVAKKGG